MFYKADLLREETFYAIKVFCREIEFTEIHQNNTFLHQIRIHETKKYIFWLIT